EVASRVAGVVLDSSPAYVTSDVTARALLAAALREPADGVADRHPAALSALRAGVDAYFALPPMRRRLEESEAAWRELLPPCPKLYLYSEADVLVDPRTIQGHMASEAARGSRVYATKWEDTPHVEHYRLHPDQYARAVGAFAAEAAAWHRDQAGGGGGGACSSGSDGGLRCGSSSGSSSSLGSSAGGGEGGSFSGSVRCNSSGGGGGGAEGPR
ncbi:MAG: hypothetical protein J3K34DRAFT_368414, partial [Monoraphidium minutum]